MVTTEDIHSNPEATAFMVKTARAIFTTGNAAERQSTPVDTSNQGTELALWGTDNLFPQNVKRDADLSVIIPQTLARQANILYSSGVSYGFENEEGEFTPAPRNPEIEFFLRNSKINRYLREASIDFYWFFNVFPNFILSRDRKKIVSLCTQEAMFTRFGLQNKKTGIIDTCYINANWDNGGTVADSIKLPAIDPYFDAVTQVRDGKDFSYIYPISYPTPGQVYYQLAFWNSVRDSKWLDLAKKIPLFKSSLMTNQLDIKYHIEVSTWYWEWKYPDWNKYDFVKRKELMSNEIKAFSDTMSGEEKAGKAFVTANRVHEHTGKEESAWKINPIDDKVKDGKYIDDSQEASLNILYGLGFDPILIGSIPGKGMGAGSGSDKRVAYNTYLSTIEPHRDIIVEPLEFISDYNGWLAPDGSPLKWRFKNSIITTLDKGKEPQQAAS